MEEGNEGKMGQNQCPGGIERSLQKAKAGIEWQDFKGSFWAVVLLLKATFKARNSLSSSSFCLNERCRCTKRKKDFLNFQQGSFPYYKPFTYYRLMSFVLTKAKNAKGFNERQKD